MSDPWILHFVRATHWDREWYMTEGRFRRRLVRMLDRLIDLLDRDPGFGPFLFDGQYLAIADYLEVRPEMRDRVAALVRDARLQVGPWYSQPICTMSSAESLVRNLLLGTRLSSALGRSYRVSHMVDEFGHAACVPLLLAGFGMSDLVIWRGLPKGSKAYLRWEGEGGDIANVFYTNRGYGNATAMPLDDEALNERVDKLIEMRRPKAESPNLLMLNGVDHAFAQENIAAIVDRINALRNDAVAVLSSEEQYIASVKAWHAEHRVPVVTLSGELQDPSESDVLPDSHSTRVRVKLANFRAESLLGIWAEPFATLAYACGGTHPGAELWRAWELLLQNHAHDSIACSSVDGVEGQVLDRFERSVDIADDIADEALAWIARRVAPPQSAESGEPPLHRLVVFNPLSHERDEVIHAVIDIPESEGNHAPRLMLGDADVPTVVRARRRTHVARYNPFRGHQDFYPVTRWELWARIDAISPVGYRVVDIVPAERPASLTGTMLSGHRTIDNGVIRVDVEPAGTLALFDSRTGRHFTGLNAFEDGGDAGHGYAYWKPQHDRVVTHALLESLEVVEDTALVTRIVLAYSLDLPVGLDHDRGTRRAESIRCPVRTTVTVRAGSPSVELETTVTNLAEDHRLRVCFPTGLRADYSCAAQPFAVAERPVATPDPSAYPKEKPLATHPMQGWCSVGDSDAGLAVAAPGLYEYEVSNDPLRSIKLTLLRCVGRVDGDALGFVEDKLIPGAQVPGEVTFRYTLVPHGGDWQDAAAEIRGTLYPVRAVVRRPLEDESLPWYRPPVADLPDAWSFVRVEPASVTLSTIKKCEERDTLVVRIHNPGRTNARVRVAFPSRAVMKAWLVRLDETRLDELAVGSGGWIAVPSEVVSTIEVELER